MFSSLKFDYMANSSRPFSSKQDKIFSRVGICHKIIILYYILILLKEFQIQFKFNDLRENEAIWNFSDICVWTTNCMLPLIFLSINSFFRSEVYVFLEDKFQKIEHFVFYYIWSNFRVKEFMFLLRRIFNALGLRTESRVPYLYQ